MKIDMHCHVREGSVDSRVSLDEYITTLKEKGFDGMLITDHDTYHGYRHWKYHMKGKVHEDFVVLKGIEYDTLDAGHIICIMPEGVKMRLLEVKGLPVSVLIDFVHRHGGILGPAHPCGEKYLSFTNTSRFYKSPELIKRFDFIEAFNACESAESNEGARKLAEKYKKPGIGGSDAHRPDCIGTGYTILPERVTCETELIIGTVTGVNESSLVDTAVGLSQSVDDILFIHDISKRKSIFCTDFSISWLSFCCLNVFCQCLSLKGLSIYIFFYHFSLSCYRFL